MGVIMAHRIENKERAALVRGFTLVELLVVIAIIGILVSLLLPAVQQVRESGRRTQCLNNLKQLALALHSYHNTLQILPPGVQVDDINTFMTTTTLRPNWVILILPHIEQQNLYNSFDFTKPISDSANITPRSRRLPIMICPTDNHTGNGPFAGNSTAEGGNWERANYGSNGGGGDPVWSIVRTWQDPGARGVMSVNYSCTFAEVRDGLSNTMLIAELRAGIHEVDRRGCWALGTAGASHLMAMGANGNAYGPNHCQDNHSDDLFGCSAIWNAVGSRIWKPECMSCCSFCNRSSQATTRSKHLGGVQMAKCDGSVRWLSNHIERGGTLSAWDNLITSTNGGTIQNY
jgi:prepilin-type N-terminal cleavage/methylation domain-containing protein